MDSENKKLCSKCGLLKNIIEFRIDPRRINTSSGGINSSCKTCENKRSGVWNKKNRDRARATYLRWYHRNPEKAKLSTYDWINRNFKKTREREKRRYLKTYYNLSLEIYEEMYKSQLGVCKICGNNDLDGKRLSVDHCHKTGTIRGLLCKKCNFGIGYFNDNTDLMHRTIEYLKKSTIKEMP